MDRWVEGNMVTSARVIPRALNVPYSVATELNLYITRVVAPDTA